MHKLTPSAKALQQISSVFNQGYLNFKSCDDSLLITTFSFFWTLQSEVEWVEKNLLNII